MINSIKLMIYNNEKTYKQTSLIKVSMNQIGNEQHLYLANHPLRSN